MDKRSGTALLRWTVLRDPALDITPPPHTPLRELRSGPWEAFDPRKLICALLRHAQHLTDFGGAYEIHGAEVTP